MKFSAKVVKHEAVWKDGVEMLKVGLKGTGVDPLKIELLVDAGDRGKYPFGSGCVVDFNVQQRLPLDA